MALAYGALVLWNLGYADRSGNRSDLSLELAERVGGPVTRAQAWGMRSILHLTRGESVELSYWVDKTLAVSIDSNIAYWRAVSSTLSGVAAGPEPGSGRRIARLEESMEDYLRSARVSACPISASTSPDLRLAAGEQAKALDALRIGEEHIEATGEGFAESELFRFKGRVLMAGGSPDPGAATVAYDRAVSSARAPERQAARAARLHTAGGAPGADRRAAHGAGGCRRAVRVVHDRFGAA